MTVAFPLSIRTVITFVNKRFEPLRGFHVFMRAPPKLLEGVPTARVVLIGSDEAGGYGQPAGEGVTWKGRLLAGVGGRLDTARVHFVGRLEHIEMLASMRPSAAHVYLTYPFVLSWSMLEAMALGCLVIGSDTVPVREVIEDKRNGLLVNFFDQDALAERLIDACTRPRSAYAHLRQAARQTILERYDRQRISVPAWLALVEACS